MITDAEISDLAARLDLSADKEAVLRETLAPRWRRRRDRLAQRDDEIRAMASFYPGMSPAASAKTLERDIGVYLASAWRRESGKSSPPEPASAKRRALYRVVRLNNGRTLGWRQILNIFDGGSTV